MRLKVLAKPRRPVALNVDAEEAAVSVEVTVVVAVAVVREDVAAAVEGPLGHLVLFVFFTRAENSHQLTGILVSRKPSERQ